MKENLPLKCATSDIFLYRMFANCDHTKTMFVHIAEHENSFSINYRKFFVEWECKSKIFQNVQNFGYFGETDGLHVTNFFQNASQMVFFTEKIFPVYFWGFFWKNQKNLDLES